MELETLNTTKLEQ